MAEDQIRSLYLEGLSEASISRVLGVGRPTIHRRLVSLGLPLRTAVEASDLGRHKTFHLTPALQSVMDGLLLGDAWVEVDARSEGRLCLEQAVSHEGWIEAVETFFTQEGVQCTRSTRKPRENVLHGKVIKGKGGALLRTRKYRVFTEQRARWYPSGLKRVPQDVDLGPLSLAHWYWGDGATSNQGYRMVFHTDGFEESEVVFLRDRLYALYGWTPKVSPRSGQKGFILTLGQASQRRDLVELIKPFCPPCFSYKLSII